MTSLRLFFNVIFIIIVSLQVKGFITRPNHPQQHRLLARPDSQEYALQRKIDLLHKNIEEFRRQRLERVHHQHLQPPTPSSTIKKPHIHSVPFLDISLVDEPMSHLRENERISPLYTPRTHLMPYYPPPVGGEFMPMAPSPFQPFEDVWMK